MSARATPRLSILFVNHESWDVLGDALESLRRCAPAEPFEVIVVDNASSPAPEARGHVEALLDEMDGQCLSLAENRGYGAGMNAAYARARGEQLLVCNPDLVFQPGCVAKLCAFLDAHADVGVAAPEVFLDRGLTLRAPVHVLPTPRDLVGSALATVSRRWNRRYSEKRSLGAWAEWEREGPIEQPMFGGCCFLTRRDLVSRIGFFDERYPLYFEDTDLARRVRAAGLRIVQVPGARVVHLYGRSSERSPAHAAAAYAESRASYFRRWYGRGGALLQGVIARLLASAPAQRARARLHETTASELPSIDPVVRLERPLPRFLVELCYDPLFLLAGGAFATGDAWWPDPELLRELRRPVWMRAVELANGTPRELGRWLYRPDGRPPPPFNRIASDFADLARPDYAAKTREIGVLLDRLQREGLPLRLDAQRDWEYAHVLLALERLRSSERIEHVLDVGGGNAPLAYLLSERGLAVTMLDVDGQAVTRCAQNALRLGLDRLRAVRAGRRAWSVPSESVHVALCISVFEGILRSDRPAFWSEMRRVLRPGGSLLVTFDFGSEARFLGDAPANMTEVERDLVAPSGLELVGVLPPEPVFGPAGPPVRNEVPAADGGSRSVAYTFGALRLRRPIAG